MINLEKKKKKRNLKDLSFEEKVKGVKKNGRRREVQVTGMGS